MTYSSGKIELNTYYMSGYSNSKKQNVATHELGHALGLDHSTSTDVMDAAITGHTSTQALSQNDKDSYDAAYNNYCKRTIASTCSYASFSAIIVSHDTESKKLST